MDSEARCRFDSILVRLKDRRRFVEARMHKGFDSILVRLKVR